MDLLSNLADIGYLLCKKRLVEIILALIGEIKLWVLIAKVERYIRHFSGADITQLIRITENDYMEKTTQDFEIEAFKTFLKNRVAIGNQMAVKVLKRKLIS